tara:strand:+ start:192 stop:455 length:264 start_codon:yes stop_codon:yes gene_type:complete
MKHILRIIITTLILILFGNILYAKNTNIKSRTKFYNFDEMLIDGEIKKPSGLLTDVRKRARFSRLLRDNRRTFLKELGDTAKEKSFK